MKRTNSIISRFKVLFRREFLGWQEYHEKILVLDELLWRERVREQNLANTT